jgi:hypothetical protein
VAEEWVCPWELTAAESPIGVIPFRNAPDPKTLLMLERSYHRFAQMPGCLVSTDKARLPLPGPGQVAPQLRHDGRHRVRGRQG